MYVVEASPRRELISQALQGKTIIYMDSEMWYQPYIDEYDQKRPALAEPHLVDDLSRSPGARRARCDLSVQARVRSRARSRRTSKAASRRCATCRACKLPSANAGTSTWARSTRLLHDRPRWSRPRRSTNLDPHDRGGSAPPRLHLTSDKAAPTLRAQELTMADSNGRPVCVVIGVGPGLGAALARKFATEYAVALVARGEDKLARSRKKSKKAAAKRSPFPRTSPRPRTSPQPSTRFGANSARSTRCCITLRCARSAN